MPKLSSEGEGNSSDGLKHMIYEGNAVDDIHEMYTFTHLSHLFRMVSK